MTNFNGDAVMVVPDIPEIWFQGNVGSTNLTVTGSMNFGQPFEFSVENNQFGGFVPLDVGTNILVVTASEGATTNSAYAFTIIRSTDYQASITSPGSDFFANGQAQLISGYVSPKINAGQPGETNLLSVAINGIAATIDWNSFDSNSNVLFQTTQAVPVATDGSWTALNATFVYANGLTNHVPLAVAEGYEFPSKKTRLESSITEFQQLFVPPCNDHWYVENGSAIMALMTYSFSAPPGSYAGQDFFYSFPTTTCVDSPIPDGIEYSRVDTNSDTSAGASLPNNLGLTFGHASSQILHAYDVDQNGVIDSQRLELTRSHWPSGDQNSITFRAPQRYKTPDGNGTAVIFTFEGMSYATGPGQEMNLTNVQYQGQSPISVTSNSASYLITLIGGTNTYTIQEGDFQWPEATPSTVTNEVANGYLRTTTATARRLSFTGFHNQGPALTIIGPNKVISLCGEDGLAVTLTANTPLNGGYFGWSTTSPNLEFVGSTTGQTVQVRGKRNKYSQGGKLEEISVAWSACANCAVAVAKFKVQVLTPWYLVSDPTAPENPKTTTQAGRYTTKYWYQIKDQYGANLVQTVTVGGVQHTIGNLKVSEVTQFICGSQDPGNVEPDTHDFSVSSSGTFTDTLSAPSGVSFNKSQEIWIHQSSFNIGPNGPTFGCSVRRNCLTFDGTTATATENTGTGTSQCCQ